jgi:hypothetical protein
VGIVFEFDRLMPLRNGTDKNPYNTVPVHSLMTEWNLFSADLTKQFLYTIPGPGFSFIQGPAL